MVGSRHTECSRWLLLLLHLEGLRHGAHEASDEEEGSDESHGLHAHLNAIATLSLHYYCIIAECASIRAMATAFCRTLCRPTDRYICHYQHFALCAQRKRRNNRNENDRARNYSLLHVKLTKNKTGNFVNFWPHTDKNKRNE